MSRGAQRPSRKVRLTPDFGNAKKATDAAFRARVFDAVSAKYGVVNICVPAAGITRDALAVKMEKETGRAVIFPLESFREVTEVNLIAPIYWALEMVARIAEDRRRRGLGRWEPSEKLLGTIVFIGSVSSQGNKGQIAYAASKAGLEGAAATLTDSALSAVMTRVQLDPSAHAPCASTTLTSRIAILLLLGSRGALVHNLLNAT